jgi:hypothetical protein
LFISTSSNNLFLCCSDLSQKLSASGDSAASTSTALESSAQSEVDEACRKLLSGMSNQDNEKLIAWANSQERLAEYPPDPKLAEALGLFLYLSQKLNFSKYFSLLEFNDAQFGNFLQDYINTECQRQACWRSDVLNVMSKRAEYYFQYINKIITNANNFTG